MAKRRRGLPKLSAPPSVYRDGEGNELALRATLTAGSRRKYSETLAGTGSSAAASREDTWQRAFEMLFERLAVTWEIAGVPLKGQAELLGRLRMASAEERRWVREALREHCAEHFPDVEAP